MNLIRWPWGGGKPPKEQLRKNTRALNNTVKELGGLITKLEAQKKSLQTSIEKNAKNGQMNVCRIQAKDYARTQNNIIKFLDLKSKLQQFHLQLQTLQTQNQMTESMKGATTALRGMNRSANLPQLQNVIAQFQKESGMMVMQQEMMDDVFDDAMDVEEESDEVVEKTLASIGVDLSQSLADTPSGLQTATLSEGKIAQAVGSSGGDPGDDDLQARLDSLRK